MIAAVIHRTRVPGFCKRRSLPAVPAHICLFANLVYQAVPIGKATVGGECLSSPIERHSIFKNYGILEFVALCAACAVLGTVVLRCAMGTIRVKRHGKARAEDAAGMRSRVRYLECELAVMPSAAAARWCRELCCAPSPLVGEGRGGGSPGKGLSVVGSAKRFRPKRESPVGHPPSWPSPQGEREPISPLGAQPTRRRPARTDCRNPIPGKPLLRLPFRRPNSPAVTPH
jgi:hypothetical protein